MEVQKNLQREFRVRRCETMQAFSQGLCLRPNQFILRDELGRALRGQPIGRHIAFGHAADAFGIGWTLNFPKVGWSEQEMTRAASTIFQEVHSLTIEQIVEMGMAGDHIRDSS